jgi:hypothetical protein
MWKVESVRYIALLLALSTPLQAQAQSTMRLPVYGAGREKCDVWANSIKTSNATMLIILTSWLGGFLSGATTLAAAMPSGFSLDANLDDAFASITSYCATHPAEPVSEAATHYINEKVEGKFGRR